MDVQIKSYPITPMGKPRMTQQDRWKKRPCVLRYHAFKDACREHSVSLSDSLKLLFVLPMPKSWSKKKKREMDGRPHQQRPDIDNLQKALFDAVLEEDANIWSVSAVKVWGQVGEIRVQNTNGPAAAVEVRRAETI